MKKIYGLVLFSLLASASTSFSMDPEDFGLGDNRNRRGSWSSGESGALADTEGSERGELESLLEVMKPDYVRSAAAGAIEWILACIHDDSVNLTNGKPTIAELRFALNAIATSVEQQDYLDTLCSEFISQNGEAFSVDGESEPDEEDGEGLAVYGLPFGQGGQEGVFADAPDSDDEEPELSEQGSQDDGEISD